MPRALHRADDRSRSSHLIGLALFLPCCSHLPDAIIGDLDSLPPRVMAYYRSHPSVYMRRVSGQDNTDLEKCIDFISAKLRSARQQQHHRANQSTASAATVDQDVPASVVPSISPSPSSSSPGTRCRRIGTCPPSPSNVRTSSHAHGRNGNGVRARVGLPGLRRSIRSTDGACAHRVQV
jgi:hypothetical protein